MLITRTNKWTFADLSQNVSKQVYDIGQEYIARFRDPKTKPRHLNAYPIQLVKYFYFLYLTGSRLMEPIRIPSPKIGIINREGKVYVTISRVNEKHFTKSVPLDPNSPILPGRRRPKNLELSEREIIDQAFPVFNEAEQATWNFITDGGIVTDAADIFQFDKWRSTSKYNLTGLIKTNFHIDLKDENGRVHRNSGITPHILRHMRVFNVMVNYGIPTAIVVKWFGWRDERMLYYYAHIRKTLNINNQYEMLKRGNFLTNLGIDLGKAIINY